MTENGSPGGKKQGSSLARNTLVVAFATLISRGLGFIRDVIVAFALGAAATADAFFVAFRVPNLLRRLFAEGSLTMAFIPVYSRVREEEGEGSAQAMARSALFWLLVILGGITLSVELLAGPLTWVIAPGFADDPETFALTTKLLRICFPYIIFISGVALCMGVLNAEGHFLTPALSPVFLNIALISAALVGYFGGWSVAECLAWGVLAGGAIQWFLQQPSLKSRGFRWRGNWSWRDRGVRRMALLMLPTVFGAAVYQINILLGTVLASFLPEGSVSYLYYADRLVQFPLGVFGIAVSTAALPELSKLAAGDRMNEFTAALRQAQGLTLFIALPAMAGLLALAEPIIALLFGRGAFTPEAVSATAIALIAYSAGLPFIAAARPLVAAFYSLQDTRTPVFVAVASLVINIGLGAGLMLVWDHVGLAVAVSASSAVNCGLLHWLLHRRLGRSPLEGRTAFVCLGLSLLVFAGAWGASGATWLWLAAIPVLVAGYIWTARLLGLEESRLLTGALARRFSRRRG